MEKFPFPPIIFLFQFLSLLLVSSFVYSLASDPPYFINCGSSSQVIVDDGRTFVGDDQNSNSFNVGESKPIKNSSVLSATSSTSLLLYQTARIYRKQSSYEIEVGASSTYLVRLHFFPFISGGTNLSDALFNVSTSKSLLFTARNASDFQVVIKEYFLTIQAGKFRIYFTPATENSFAFVNAIEVILLADDFIGDFAKAVPPVAGVNGNFFGLLSNSLKTLYRINVGGSEVESDTLWRHWDGDDRYLVTESSAKNFTSDRLGRISGDDAVLNTTPVVVYKTCKQLNSNTSSNITWDFNVRKRVRHLVRLHFCDIISPTLGVLEFDLYIYSNFSIVISPSDYILASATPFYDDFVVDSDDSGYMNITIGKRNDSEIKDAFLNGLELMEFVANETRKFPEAVDGNSSKHSGLIIGISVGGSVSFIILIILILFVVRRRKGRSVRAFVPNDDLPQGRGRPHSWMTATSDNTASPLPNLNLKLRMPLSEVLAATCNFDTKLLIGEGGFGKVYKGTLPDGTKVAVKRSDSSHGQGLPEFQTEVTVLSNIRHRHLVSLIGYCDEGSEMILVYEFMEKGTLRDHLYIWKENSENASDKIPELSWKQRLEICIDSAKGLHYLHTGSDWGIIHRDVKSTNILLDAHFVAKVADFGLSKSGPPDLEQSNMDLIGSFGYLDPEYVRTFQLTYKSDVYSFGVVLLEVLCARPPIINSSKREEINLAEWGMSWQKKGQLEKIIDPSLTGEINPNSLRKFGEIAEKCLKREGAERPTMLDVCWDLEYALQLQQTAVYREPHEDSTTEVSSNYLFPISSTPNHLPHEDEFLYDRDDDEFDSKLEFSRSMITGPR